MQRLPNVIVLTSGLSGSSVIAGLLERAGYWLGERTLSKPDYDTFENAELVALNDRLLRVLPTGADFRMAYSDQYFQALKRRHASDSDITALAAFVERCKSHRPWLWKDPRLWLTVHLWEDHLRKEDVRFIVVTREPLQSWISTTCRRQIQSYSHAKRYIEETTASMISHLERSDREYLHLVYEDLLTQPADTLSRLNAFLGTSLGIDDLGMVYREPLGRRQRGASDFLKALLIHAKNFRERRR